MKRNKMGSSLIQSDTVYLLPETRGALYTFCSPNVTPITPGTVYSVAAEHWDVNYSSVAMWQLKLNESASSPTDELNFPCSSHTRKKRTLINPLSSPPLSLTLSLYLCDACGGCDLTFCCRSPGHYKDLCTESSR